MFIFIKKKISFNFYNEKFVIFITCISQVIYQQITPFRLRTESLL